VHFIVAALGRDCDDFTLHIYASLAEQERKMISERIKAALARSQKKLGLRHPTKRSTAFRRRLRARGSAAIRKAARERAEAYRVHIEWALSQPGTAPGTVRRSGGQDGGFITPSTVVIGKRQTTNESMRCCARSPFGERLKRWDRIRCPAGVWGNRALPARNSAAGKGLMKRGRPRRARHSRRCGPAYRLTVTR
jgi:hypothetical protein